MSEKGLQNCHMFTQQVDAKEPRSSDEYNKQPARRRQIFYWSQIAESCSAWNDE